jgi:hypothetical protein
MEDRNTKLFRVYFLNSASLASRSLTGALAAAYEEEKQ